MDKNSVALPKEKIDAVIALYSSGKIKQAIQLIRVLNKDYPNVPLLFNILGVCYKALGHLKKSIEMFDKATAIKPDFAEAHNNLGITQMQLGQLDDAVKSFQRALTINPNYAEVHNNLGITLKELNQLDDAVKSYEKAITIKPDYFQAHNNLGNILKTLGRFDDAVKAYQQTLAIKPEFAEAHNNLGNARKGLGQLDDALKSFIIALSYKPDFAEAHNNLGITQMQLGQLDDAVKSFQRALTINPNYAEVHNNLGITLKELNQLDDAVKSYEKAITIKPSFAEPHNNLGTIFKERGQFDAAANCYEKALAIKPNYAYALNNLGTIFKERGDLEKAAQYYSKALSIIPSFAEAHSNIGDLMVTLKRLDEALLSYQSAYSLKPEIDFLIGNLLHTKMRLCDWSGFLENLNKLKIKINKHETPLSLFSLLALIDDSEVQMKASKTHVNKYYPKNLDLPIIEKHPKRKKIRIGYFSADFRAHPVSELIVELFEVHDRSRFEIYAFSFGRDTHDEMNLRIKRGVDHFYDLHTMPHKDAAIFIRSLEMDIAVNLGGHTLNAPTEVFAISVAPTQVSYLGFAGTMGASYIDYLIADHTVIPKSMQNHYAENIVYLPDSYMVNDSKIKASKKTYSREDVGLPAKGFVFCCFNNHYKITPSVFSSWMRVLSKATGSVLWLAETNSIAAYNLKKEAKIKGIDPNRLIFAPRLILKEDHLSRIQLADLFIDTLPFNAHVTASDALRVGLPVLTCKGNSFASRVAASLLNAVSLPELITTTQKQYESLAIELAEYPEKLKRIKDKLHNTLSTASLFDTPLFTKNIESAYLKMYDRSQRGLNPDHIYVEQYKETKVNRGKI